MRKAYLYHIGLNDNLSDGYIGITVDPSKRFTGHKSSKKGYKITEMIHRHGLTKDNMRILVIGSLPYVKKLERKLRPKIGIGWNQAVGGGGANNVGEHAYNYKPENHHDCKGGCGKIISIKNNLCHNCWTDEHKENAKKYADNICPDCGSKKEGKGGYETRCKPCFRKYMKKNNPAKILEPYTLVNIETGEAIEIAKGLKQWCEDQGMSHKANARFSEIRKTIRTGNYASPRNGKQQRRFEYKGWTLDERKHGMNNYPAVKAEYHCGRYGVFYSYDEISVATGFDKVKIANMIHRDNTEWTVAEVELLEWINEQHRTS